MVPRNRAQPMIRIMRLWVAGVVTSLGDSVQSRLALVCWIAQVAGQKVIEIPAEPSAAEVLLICFKGLARCRLWQLDLESLR